MNILLLAVSILPVVVLLIYVYRRDKYEKEPLRMLCKALLFGALSVIPALIMEMVMMQLNPVVDRPVLSGLYDGFCVAGFCEEFCKLLLLWLCVWFSRYFDEYFDGIVYSACIALGFACVENVGYVFGGEDFAGALQIGVMRALLSVPGHFLFGVVMGYHFALARFNKRGRLVHLFLALLVPMLLHGIFDALLMIPENLGEGAEIVASAMFFVFIAFDVLLWRIGSKRLVALQHKSAEQQKASSHGEGYHQHNGYNYRQNGGENDVLEDIDWDV